MVGNGWKLAVVAGVSLCASLALAQERKIVVGPRNAELAEGAHALLDGEGEEGVRLTLAGLRHAVGRQERLTGTSNLCAGYILLERYNDALEECNSVLAEDESHWRARTNRALIYVLVGRYDAANADLDRVEQIAPQARTVIGVRELLRDRLNPVEPIVIIDERREAGDDEEPE